MENKATPNSRQSEILLRFDVQNTRMAHIEEHQKEANAIMREQAEVQRMLAETQAKQQTELATYNAKILNGWTAKVMQNSKDIEEMKKRVGRVMAIGLGILLTTFGTLVSTIMAMVAGK